jgi:hypothetical protein
MTLRALAVLLALAATTHAWAEPAVEGVDHIPLAVNDLEQAVIDFHKLGFVLKPGRPHDDGIRNSHVKFRDGTEIELITVASPTDALASTYMDWLKGGDGPAHWALYNPDLPALTKRLTSLGLHPTDEGDVVSLPQSDFPHQLFFADRLWSPTDRPEHYAHPNTAYRLEAIWLAGAPGERRLALALGAVRERHANCAPFGADIEALSLPEGDEVMFAPASARATPGRSIIGATVMVRNLKTTADILKQNQIGYVAQHRCGHESLWVGPKDAHNLWIEFRR